MAEQRLQDTLAGSYLLRVASSGSGMSLSLKVPAKVSHFKISKKLKGPSSADADSGLWYLVGKPTEFETISGLIEHYAKTECTRDGHTRLVYPCPTTDESPYVDMRDDVFVNKTAYAGVRRKSVMLQSAMARQLDKGAGTVRLLASSGTAFVVGDRVEIIDKGAGTVRFVGLHHVEGTYGNSSTLLSRTMCAAPYFFPRATHTVLHRPRVLGDGTEGIACWDAQPTHCGPRSYIIR